jgi:hypothetical protein
MSNTTAFFFQYKLESRMKFSYSGFYDEKRYYLQVVKILRARTTTVLVETNMNKTLFLEITLRAVTHKVKHNLGHIPRNNSKASLWQAELHIPSWQDFEIFLTE